MERSTTVRIQLAASPGLCAELRRALRPTFPKILPGDITSGEDIVAMIDDACPTIVLLEATLPELDLPPRSGTLLRKQALSPLLPPVVAVVRGFGCSAFFTGEQGAIVCAAAAAL